MGRFSLCGMVFALLMHSVLLVSAEEIDASASSTEWSRRLQEEGPAIWTQWYDLLREKSYKVTMQVRVEEQSSIKIDGRSQEGWKEIGDETTVYRRMNDHHLATLVNNMDEPVSHAWGSNDKYYFVIKKLGDASWTVRHLGRPGERPESLDTQFPIDVPFHYTQFFVEGVRVESLIRDKSFVIKSIEPESDGRLRVEFESEVSPDPHNTIIGGSLWFLPDQYWLLDEYDVSVKSRTEGKAHQQMVYQDFGGLPVIQDVNLTYEFQGDPPLRHLYEYTWEQSSIPAKTFTLSNFGIPEPGLSRESTRKTPPWIWLNLIALGFVGLAALVHQVIRRRR